MKMSDKMKAEWRDAAFGVLAAAGLLVGLGILLALTGCVQRNPALVQTPGQTGLPGTAALPGPAQQAVAMLTQPEVSALVSNVLVHFQVTNAPAESHVLDAISNAVASIHLPEPPAPVIVSNVPGPAFVPSPWITNVFDLLRAGNAASAPVNPYSAPLSGILAGAFALTTLGAGWIARLKSNSAAQHAAAADALASVVAKNNLGQAAVAAADSNVAPVVAVHLANQ